MMQSASSTTVTHRRENSSYKTLDLDKYKSVETGMFFSHFNFLFLFVLVFTFVQLSLTKKCGRFSLAMSSRGETCRYAHHTPPTNPPAPAAMPARPPAHRRAPTALPGHPRGLAPRPRCLSAQGGRHDPEGDDLRIPHRDDAVREGAGAITDLGQAFPGLLPVWDHVSGA